MSKWLLAGFAPLAAWAAWVIRGALLRRRRMGRPLPRAYGLEAPPGARAGGYQRPAAADPGEEYAQTSVGERQQPEMRPVPVTAKKKPTQGPRASRGGAARVYESASPQGSPDSTPRTIIFDKGRTAPFPWLLALIPLLILGVVTFMGLQDRNPARAEAIVVPGGDPETGRQAIQSWGCGSCHTIPGVAGARGKVGPQLNQLAEQTYLAGMLENNPENMIRWIMNPQEIQPGNAMPNTGVPEPTARDMAAYLYSIR